MVKKIHIHRYKQIKTIDSKLHNPKLTVKFIIFDFLINNIC